MSKIVLEGTLPDQLRMLNLPVQLCDAQGQVLGQFIPAVDLSQWDINEPPLDPEEKKRRFAEDRRLTTAEFLAALEKL